MVQVHLIAFVVICIVSSGSTKYIKPQEDDKRFLFDTFFDFFVGIPAHMMTSFMTSAISSECVQCKCYQSCSAATFFGDHVHERDICGHQVWDEINCAGVTRPPPTTTEAPQILPNGTSVTYSTTSTLNSCDKMCVIGSMAQAHSMSNNNTPICYSGKHAGNEALPMVCCGINEHSTWKRGLKVMDTCSSTDLTYSPVAAFVNGEYVPGSAGVFVACKKNGFQMAVQTCDKTPYIAAVSSHKDSYYVIEQL